MKAEIKNGRLEISVNLQEPRRSKSGKTLVVASTRGFRLSDVEVAGKRVRISINACIDSETKNKAR